MMMFVGLLFYNTGKIVLGLLGIKKPKPEIRDPNRIKTLDEVKQSREIVGTIDTFSPKAKRIGFLTWLVLLTITILLLQ